MTGHRIVSAAEWLDASRALLAEEKEFTRRRDELSRRRRELPWVKVEKDYVFDAPEGKVSLADLFGGKGQLVVQHFMFGPDWNEGCPSCSFWTDNFIGIVPHLAHRDTAFVLVSRGPIDRLEVYRKRMGWPLRWVSSAHNDFNVDFGVSAPPGAKEMAYNFGTGIEEMTEKQGFSALRREDGEIYRTYSTYARGVDMLNGAYNLLDLTSKGRDEDGFPFPMTWVRRHDKY